MHVVFTSGKVSMKVCRVDSPLLCIGGFRMDDGKLGIQEVYSSWPVLTAACLAEQVYMTIVTYSISSGIVRRHVGKPEGPGQTRPR